jgi:DNA recombination protein RmuC
MQVVPLLALIASAAAVAAAILVLRAMKSVARSRDLETILTRMETLERAQDRVERTIRDETARLRDGMGADSRALREEVVQSLSSMLALVQQQLAAIQDDNGRRLEQMRATVGEKLQGTLDETARLRETIAGDARATRAELAQAMANSSAQVQQQLETVRAAVDTQLKSIQDDNGRRLEQMRATVDEKLQGTLEKRLGESFRMVSERLEKVHQGLGEMQALAEGVGDLKKVLTNVKTRGTWGEVQLGSLLEQVLSPEQFERNVAVAGGSERVEYAIRLPGRDNSEAAVWLPIDAKFPQEDYTRLVEASERADAEAVELAARQLELRLKACARDICLKYVAPPKTTDFAILFLPTEGLYAEALRRNGLAESLQRDWRVVLAGPTTLAALLNSLQMGFRTLAIQKRSSEVWEVLGGVKSEFAKYAGVLDKVQKKLHEASNTVDEAAKRTRAIERKLRNVESAEDPAGLLEGFDEDEFAHPLTHSAGR